MLIRRGGADGSWPSRRLLLLCFAASLCLTWGNTELFSQEVAKHFVQPTDPASVLATAAKDGKPGMVIVMTTWCHACNGIRKLINAAPQVQELMSSFLVVYTDTDEGKAAWQVRGEEYVPQFYFFTPSGKRLPILSNRAPQFKYFFEDEASILAAMKQALEMASHPDHTKPDPEHEWASDLSAQLFESFEPQRVREKAAADGKPFMVVLTQPWCEACHEMVKSINGGEQVRKLLPQFVVAHAHGEQGQLDWQRKGEEYVPQAYFFNSDGSPLDVPPAQEKYRHFFATDAELGAAMTSALELKSDKKDL